MIRFALRLVRPYWRWLLIVLGAMLVDTAMGLASPWPLKIVLDSVFDAKPMPAAFVWLVGANADRLARLNVAVVTTIVIALAPGRERVSQRLLHRQHRPVDRARPAPQRLRAPAAAVDVLLRQAAGRAAHQHDHRRHQRGPGLRVHVAARHPDRRPDRDGHARGHVHAELALHAGRAGRDAAGRRVRVPAPRRRQAGDPRRAAASERDRLDRPGRPRRHPRRQGVRAGRLRAAAARRQERGKRRGGALRPARAIAARPRRHHAWWRSGLRRCSGSARGWCWKAR